MARIVRASNRAQLDIAESAEFISRDNVDAALRFIDAVDQLSDALAANPLIGHSHPHPRFSNLRSSIVTGFPSYVAYYQVRGSDILLVRVLHGARDAPLELDSGV